ncbi:MAG: hypothetical protein ACP5E5_02420, partial [Acidobacteriaceae bacterium]
MLKSTLGLFVESPRRLPKLAAALQALTPSILSPHPRDALSGPIWQTTMHLAQSTLNTPPGNPLDDGLAAPVRQPGKGA